MGLSNEQLLQVFAMKVENRNHCQQEIISHVLLHPTLVRQGHQKISKIQIFNYSQAIQTCDVFLKV